MLLSDLDNPIKNIIFIIKKVWEIEKDYGVNQRLNGL